MLRDTLARYGLSSEDIDSLMANFSNINEIINAKPSEISSITKLSIQEVISLQNFLKKNKPKNNVGHDFLKRWGKVTSEEDLRSAYEEYTHLSKLYPKSPIVWETRGEILEKMGKFEDAKRAYEKAYMLYLQRGKEPPKELKEKIRKKIVSYLPHKKTGLSNGSGNINGFKNGIINGAGIVNGTLGGGRKPSGATTWKIVVSIGLVFLIIAAPLVGFIFFEKHYVYAVDGNFGEWQSGTPYYGLKEGNKDVNIDYVKFHPSENGLYFYIRLSDPKPFSYAHGIYIFLDTDNSSSTGYLVDGIGADYMIELYGWNSTLRGKILYKFNSTDQNDYTGFKSIQSIGAILVEDQIEGFAPLQINHFRAIVISYNYANQQDVAPCPYYGKNALIIRELENQTIIKVNELSYILTLKFYGPSSMLKSLKMRYIGTANIKNISGFTLELNNKKIKSNYKISDNYITFQNLNLQIPQNSKVRIGIMPLSMEDIQKTIGLSIVNIIINHPYFIQNEIMGASYIEKIPAHPVIDGSFLDWRNVHIFNDTENDVITPHKINIIDKNIDILHYGDYISNSSMLVYLQVQGRILGGTDVPIIREWHWKDSDHDTVPDKFDPYPHDFNNDGIPDNESYVVVNGTKLPDVDGDGIPDYPYGPDMWLNTTIPSWFPKPYAGRHVSVYIGPVPHKKIYGVDTIDIYINSDGNNKTGFSLPQFPFGADCKVELFGRDGKVFNAALYRYTDSGWKFVRHVKYALGYNSLEIDTTVPKGNVLIVASNWRDDRDISDKTIINIKNHSLHSQLNLNFTSKNITKRFNNLEMTKKTSENLKLTLYPTFGTNIPITTSPNNEKQPSITRTSNGILWVVYDNNSNYLSLAVSRDNGSTWEISHPFHIQANNPIIISDSHNNVYIFYENHSSNSNFSYIKIIPTNTLTLYMFSSTNWWKYIYDLSAANYKNYTYLFFDYHPNSYYYIGYLSTPDLGKDWNSFLIFNVTSFPGYPQVTVTSGLHPKVFVAFEYDYSKSNYSYSFITLIYNNTGVGNNSWYFNQLIYASTSSGFGYRGTFASSIASSGDEIYVAMDSQYGYMILISIFGVAYWRWIPEQWDIFIAYSKDNGETWSITQVTSTLNNNERFPFIIVNAQDAYLFYINTTSLTSNRGYVEMVYSHDGGNSWSIPIVVSNKKTGVSLYRTISSIYSNGKLYVVWTDNRNKSNDIYFANSLPEFNSAMIPLIAIVSFIIIIRRKRKSTNKI